MFRWRGASLRPEAVALMTKRGEAMGTPFIAVLVPRAVRHKVLARLVAATLAIVVVLAAGSGHVRQADGKAPAAQTAPDVTIQVLGQNQLPQSLTGGSLVN